MITTSTSRFSLTPEKYFARISHIDIKQDLIERGLDHLLLDVDNTLRSRATHSIPRDVAVWMGKARDAGVAMCLLSNNWHSDIYAFAGELDIPIVAKACKPLPFGFTRAMHKIDGDKASTVVVGDQLTTDVLGAHLAGLPAYLVQPLATVDLKHTLVLRNFESMVLHGRQPERVPEMSESLVSMETAEER